MPGALPMTMQHFTGTRPVTEQHAFDAGALQAWLQDHLPGFAGPLRIEQFKGGQSNPTFKLVTPGAAYVLRSKPAPRPSYCRRRMRSSASTASWRHWQGTACRCRRCWRCARTKP